MPFMVPDVYAGRGVPFAHGVYSVPFQHRRKAAPFLPPPSFRDQEGREVHGVWVWTAQTDGYTRYRALPTVRPVQRPANAPEANGGAHKPEETGC